MRQPAVEEKIMAEVKWRGDGERTAKVLLSALRALRRQRVEIARLRDEQARLRTALQYRRENVQT